MTQKPDFWWFEGDTVIALAAQLAYFGPGNARVKVIPKDGGVFLQVVAAPSARVPGAADFSPMNESHPCPPQC